MSSEAALPSCLWNSSGTILTVIVPAPNGCNLNCPFCYIRQRGEDKAAAVLSPLEYVRFIEEVSERVDVDAVCIQGYEPLLPDAFDWTKMILEHSYRLCIPVCLITNGTYLEDSIEGLKSFAPNRLTVSLDAGDPIIHDRQRGKTGAHAAAVRGLKAAIAGFKPETELAVTSVLIPKRREQLEDMPELLAEIGIRQWTVNALRRVGKTTPGGAVGDRVGIMKDIDILRQRAEEADIRIVVDDEFDRLRIERTPQSFVVNRLAAKNKIYRLAPDGRCSKGIELLQVLDENTRIWRSNLHAGDFLVSL